MRRRLWASLALLETALLMTALGWSSPAAPYDEVVNSSGRAQLVLDGATGRPIYIGGRPWTVAPGETILSHPWGDSPRFVYGGQRYHFIGSVGRPFRFFLVPDWGGPPSPARQGASSLLSYTPVANSSGQARPVLDGATGQLVYFGDQPWTIAPGEAFFSYPWGDSPRFVYGGRSYHYIGSVGNPFRFFLVEDWSANAFPLLPPPDASRLLRDHAGAIVDLTNRERLAAGLASLITQAALSAAAESYAAVLGRLDWFDHRGPDGSLPWDRAQAAGYGGWKLVGENLFAARPLSRYLPPTVVADWMQSPGHRANILNPAFQDIGVGCYLGGDGDGRFWCVQLFGAR